MLWSHRIYFNTRFANHKPLVSNYYFWVERSPFVQRPWCLVRMNGDLEGSAWRRISNNNSSSATGGGLTAQGQLHREFIHHLNRNRVLPRRSGSEGWYCGFRLMVTFAFVAVASNSTKIGSKGTPMNQWIVHKNEPLLTPRYYST